MELAIPMTQPTIRPRDVMTLTRRTARGSAEARFRPAHRKAPAALLGRRRERELLARLVEGARAGRGGALVVRGEPGSGKSALLDDLVHHTAECRVARAVGVEAEMELPFAALHQLCAPMIDRLDVLPAPQRDALRVAFALSGGDPPDRFLVGLAVLSLFSEMAEERPLVCVVDDVQWLDRASAQALGFVAHRLLAEPVAMVFSICEPCDQAEWTELPELTLEGLGDADARALLDSALPGPMDVRVRDRIVAETRGNPLALLELPRGLSPSELAGGFGVPDATPIAGRIQESFSRRLADLPDATRQLLLVAAAEPLGEPLLVWAAAEQLGIDADDAAPASLAGLAEFGARVRFRHPLVRSAIYHAASPAERRAVHAAVAEVTNLERDPDRRAWHLAHATSGPDEGVASELERSADRAQARGGLAAAAAFLERATALTPDPARRSERALAAARAKNEAGAFDAALALLATAQAGPLDPVQQIRVDRLRAQIALASGRGVDAVPMLLQSARRLEPLDIVLARETYLDALSAASSFGGGRVLEVAMAARAAAREGALADPRAADLLLDGMVRLLTDGYVAALPTLERALEALRVDDTPRAQEPGRLCLACRAAVSLWQDDTWDALSVRQVQLARESGALAVLPSALDTRAAMDVFAGDFAGAASLLDEAQTVVDATGSQVAPFGALTLAVWRGSEERAGELMERLQPPPLTARWAAAVLYNSLGRYEEALLAAEEASADAREAGTSHLGLVELVEAASRTGNAELAAGAIERLTETTRASGTDWALGMETRCRALLAGGADAEALYREALELLGRTRMHAELARTHLLYGEWLRRERRHRDARDQLRTARDMFTTMGAEAFAERAARELHATGETARKRTQETRGELTAQEAQVARLAREGLSNTDIGARLFISPRTVEYHLHKVFNKLGISSRRQLDHALADEPDGAAAA